MAKGAGDAFATPTGDGDGFDATADFATGAGAVTGFAAAFCMGFAVAFTASFGAAFAVVAGFAAGLAAAAATGFFFEGATAADLVIGVLDFDFNDTDLEAAFLGVSLLFFVIAFSTPSAITFIAAIDNEPSSRWRAAATMNRARDAGLLR